MQPTKFCKVALRDEPCTHHYGGSTDVGLLGENHHKINLIISEGLLAGEGVVPFG